MKSVEAILQGILRGTTDLRGSLSALSPHIEAHFSGTYRQFRSVPAIRGTVPLRAATLLPVLQSFLAGVISAQTVSEWASFILAVDAYALPDTPDSDHPDSEAEAIREALWSLSSAPASAAVTAAAVRQRVALLSAFQPTEQSHS